MQEFTVADEDDDIRLDRWFKRHFPQVSNAFLQKYIRRGLVRLDGKKVQSSVRIASGQELKVADELLMGEAPKKERPALTEEQIAEMRAMVIYENDTCIVLNKPAGLAVQGGSGIKDSIDDRLGALARNGQRPKLVHRIDRDTSGILVLARNAKSATKLTQAFASKEMEKTYWALVVGVPEIREGKIDLSLEKTASGKAGYERMEANPKGKRAITIYRVIDTLGEALCWVELMPLTGRTHQLRAHMHAIGHPILGDGKYGGEEAFIESMDLPKQLHLHARAIKLDGVLDVTAKLPPHMQHSFRELNLDETRSES